MNGSERLIECLTMTIQTLRELLTAEQTANRQYSETLMRIYEKSSESMRLSLFPSPVARPREADRESPDLVMEWDQPTTLMPDPLADILTREKSESDQMLTETLSRLRQYDPSYGFGPMDQLEREITNPTFGPTVESSANNSASWASLRAKLLAIQGEATPTIDRL